MKAELLLSGHYSVYFGDVDSLTGLALQKARAIMEGAI